MVELIEILQRNGHVSADPSSLLRDELLEAVRALPEGPLWAEGFCWLLGWVGGEPVQDVLAEMLSSSNAPALAEMVDCLETIELPQSFRRRAWEGFRGRFEERTQHYWARVQALRGAVIVSQGSPVLVKRLQACLLDVSLDDDRQYLRHVAKVTGSILRQYPDDDFRSLLGQLSEVDNAHDEAALELGLDRLKESLVAPTQEALLAALSLAHDWFEKALQHSERRPDAALFDLCTQILIGVQSRGLEPALHDRLPEIRRAAIEYSAFAGHHHAASSWLATSALERFHWLSMATKLARAAESLSKEIWLDVALVIEDELLSIFYPGREVFGCDDLPGIDLVARDAVVKRLQERRYYLQAVDQWLSENPGHAKATTVASLRSSVQAELEATLYRRPFEDTTSSRLVEVLTQAGYSEAEASMAAAQIGVSVDRNGKVAELWQEVRRKFSDQHDCKVSAKARELLEFLTALILRFLDFRANVGVNTDPASEYLFRRGSDPPVEHDLQLDFLKFLHSNDAPSFRAEARDSGGGRADIAIEYRGVRTIIEMKKDDNVPDNAALASRYAGQASGYLTTDVRFGFLLVLDLTDRKGHQPNIAEQISVERKIPKGSTTEYRIVVARIQACRKTPHELR